MQEVGPKQRERENRCLLENNFASLKSLSLSKEEKRLVRCWSI